ncbi:MAG TPA: F0F1 ATP synthase subunit epsilon [Mycobacteriales bacterium]|nr:F0F1 ATP synthase subunit epsilon [Mycobacteriales bacterium]
MATMHVELVSPEREVWSGEAEAVFARTTDGELGILPGHAPMIGALVDHPVRIVRGEGDELVAAVFGGFLSVLESGVSVLAETVELVDEIDVANARQELDRNRGAGPEDQEARVVASRAEARLRAAGESV